MSLNWMNLLFRWFVPSMGFDLPGSKGGTEANLLGLATPAGGNLEPDGGVTEAGGAQDPNG